MHKYTRLSVAVALAVEFFLVTSATAQQGGNAPARLNRWIAKLEKGEVPRIPVDMQYLDFEHNPPVYEELNKRIAEAWQKGVPTIVMTSALGVENPTWMVKQILDAGAMAVRFARIETRAQMERAIRAMRYPPQRGSTIPQPEGLRGCC